MPSACSMTAVATRKLPTFVVRNPRMRPGSLNHMNRAMKYVTPSTEMIETRACVVMARLLLDISIRSRIVRPTVANVGARLPPTSQCTERAEANSRNVSSGTRSVSAAKHGLRRVAELDAIRDFFELLIEGRPAFAYRALQGLGQSSSGAKRAHHEVDRVGQLGFDLLDAALGEHRVELPAEHRDDHPAGEAIDRAKAGQEPQRGHRAASRQKGQEPMPTQKRLGRPRIEFGQFFRCVERSQGAAQTMPGLVLHPGVQPKVKNHPRRRDEHREKEQLIHRRHLRFAKDFERHVDVAFAQLFHKSGHDPRRNELAGHVLAAPSPPFEAEDVLHLRSRAFHAGDLGDAVDAADAVLVPADVHHEMQGRNDLLADRREGSSMPAISTIVSIRAIASRGLLA